MTYIEVKPRADRHLFLFAKGHYKYSGDPVPAIKIIIKDYSGVNVNVQDVYRWVFQRVDEIARLDPNFSLSEFVSKASPHSLEWQMLYKDEWEYNKAMLRQALSVLRMSKLNKSHLGEPDPKIAKKLDKLNLGLNKNKKGETNEIN